MEVELWAELTRGDTIDVWMGAVDEERNPYTGATIYRRRDERTVERMPDYGAFEATEVAVAPAAYLVPADLTRVIERLEAHGVRLARLDADVDLELSAFRIDSTRAVEREYEGQRPRQVWGEWEPGRQAARAGAVVVPVRQALGRLAVMLLEPRSDDGFLTWNLLDGVIEETGGYPIARMTDLPVEVCEECARFR
jgi:hypothetical protein